MCDLHNFLCYLSVSESYSHLVRGLFGTNDGENNNEFMKMDNTLAADKSDFVNAYELSKESNCQASSPASTGGEPNQYCASLFDDEAGSKFAPCYDTVDKAPFFVRITKSTSFRFPPCSFI